MPKIEFLVDHFSREGIFCALMKHIMEGSAEVSCDHQDIYLKHDKYDFFERSRHKVDILVTPSYNIKSTPHIQARAVRQSARLVLQHSEQLFPDVFNEAKFNVSTKKQFSQDVYAHIVWGKEYARKLREISGVPRERIYICGNPKLELARRFQKKKNPDIQKADAKRSDKPTVLFVSNFLFGDFDNERAKNIYRTYRINVDVPMHEKVAAFREKSLEMIRRAANKFSNIQFVLRPHPGESELPYRALLTSPNISLSSRGELGQDIQNADLVLMHTSSSIFEVLASGRNALSLDVGCLPRELAQPPLEIFDWVSEERLQEVLTALGKVHKLPKVEEYRMQVMSDCMHDPFGNSIARHAIAFRHIHKRAESELGEKWSLSQRIRAIKNGVVPLVKHASAHAGYLAEKLTGKPNPMTKYARGRWQNRLDTNNHLSEAMWNEVQGVAISLLSEDDRLKQNGWESRVRLTEQGWQID